MIFKYARDYIAYSRLFQSLLNEKKILENGLKININGRIQTFYIYFYGFLADLTAKALCFNVKQFNGNFGCTYCLLPGTSP